jgi:hypothetical protein
MRTQLDEPGGSSLYGELAVEPLFESLTPTGPGTMETHAIETIDNDVAMALPVWPASQG